MDTTKIDDSKQLQGRDNGTERDGTLHRTHDLHQAAYLWCHGLEPVIEPAGLSKVEFGFSDSRVCALLDAYVRGDARVEPLRFSAAIRELKHRTRELIR